MHPGFAEAGAFVPHDSARLGCLGQRGLTETDTIKFVAGNINRERAIGTTWLLKGMIAMTEAEIDGEEVLKDWVAKARRRDQFYAKGNQLRRSGADEACIICGMPDLPGFLTNAHIHKRDLRFSPNRSPGRVFRLCWFHHHGWYDQGYITTEELIFAEGAWIEGDRPKPHRRDLAKVREINSGRRPRLCTWVENRQPA